MDFPDEHTPLPENAPALRDPSFPTGAMLQIELGDDEDEIDSTSLYQRLRFVSPCETLDELACLYAPYFADGSLFLFTTDVCDVGTRALVELVLATDECALRGLAQVVEAHKGRRGPGGRPGMRLRFGLVTGSSATFLDELGEVAHALHDPTTTPAIEPAQAPGTGGTIKMHAFPKALAAQTNETVQMSRLELADAMGLDKGDGIRSWNDLLGCRMSISAAGESDVPAPAPPPHQTSRTVVSELVEEIDAARAAPDDNVQPDDTVQADDANDALSDELRPADYWWWPYRWSAAAVATGVLVVVLALLATS